MVLPLGCLMQRDVACAEWYFKQWIAKQVKSFQRYRNS